MWSSGQVLLLALALGSVRAQDAVIGFDQTTYDVAEGDGSVMVTVAVLSGTLDQDIEVTVSTVIGSSATAGSDYTNITTTLTFMNGSTTPQNMSVTIDILDDTTVEDSESFDVTLSTTETNVMIAPASATVNIQDGGDSVTIGFDDTAYTVTEGGSASVNISVLSGTLDRDVVVTVQTVGGTATASADYTTVSTDLTFNATTSTQTVEILTTGDMMVEMSESFNVSLSQTPADSAVTLDPASTTVNIQDNTSVTVGFDEATYTVTEGGSANVSVSVLSGTVTLDRDVVVTLQTMDGSSTDPADYTAVSTDLTFNATTRTQPVDITTAVDMVLEMPESFSVSLSQTPADPAVTLDPASTTVNIQDGTSVTIGFNEAAYTVTEGGSVSVSVSVLSGTVTLDRDVVVTLQTVDGTATDSADYTTVTSDLTFNATTTTQTVEIPTTGDMVLEMSESFNVSLSQTPADPAVMLDPASTTVNIQDGTSVTIGFDDATYSVTEGVSASVSVSMLSGTVTLDRNVVVTLQTVDGTATASADYTTMSTDLTFNAVTPTQTVEIPTTDDMVLEMPESFNVSLSQTPADTAVTLDPASTTVNIQDNTFVQIGFQNSSYVVAENAGPVEVIATITGQVQLDREVIVTFTTVDGTASAPDDYTAVSQDVTFGIGSNVVRVDITIQSDSMNEMTAEMFSVILSSGDSAVVLGRNVTTVTIVDPPDITTGPSAQANVIPGMSAVFTVVATGSDLTYQWQRAGVNLTDVTKYSGITTASLTVMSVEEADEATFRCIVTNAVDSVTSSGALLTVLDPPKINSQPVNQLEVDPGSIVMFNVTATADAEAPSYQWQRDNTNIAPASRVSGINSSTLTITNVEESDEGSYRCVVTNDAGNTNSDPAQLSVLDPPVITTQPQNQRNAIPGSNVMFTVTAAGLRLNYTWEQGNGSALPSDSRFDASTDTLTIQNVVASDVGSYRCVVTNAAGSNTSSSAELTLIGPPDITDPPLNVAVERGSDVEFTCTATGLGSLTFNWTTTASALLPSSVETSNSTAMTATSTLSLTGVDADYRGEYTCRVSNERGSDSDQATLTVIVIEDIVPDNVTATLGTNVMFNCSAFGSLDISYNWTRTLVDTDGSLVDVGFNSDTEDRVVGVNTPLLTILNVSVLDVEEGQDYTCFVNVSDTTVGYRRAILRTRTVTILEPLPSMNVSEGEDFTLKCVAQNNNDAPGKLQFFWYRNDQGLVNGTDNIRIVSSGENASREASSELVVVNVMDADSGNYTCRVTNRDLVDAISVDSEITVLFSPKLNFSTGGEILNGVLRRNVGEDLTLSCTATAVPPATFVEIRRNGIVVSNTPGSDSRSLSVDYSLPTTLMLNDSAVYGCVANNSEGMTVQSFTLQVQDIPGEVDNNTVVRILVSLTSVRLTWDQPEENSGPITGYNITFCPADSDDMCPDQPPTTISDFTTDPSAVLEVIPVRRYRVYIRAENGAGLGPQPQPYFFDSANADDAQPVNLAVPFVSENGVVLSWQLPDIAMSEQDVDFSVVYTRQGSGDTTTVTVETPRVSIGGLESGRTYDFAVSAMYPLLNSTAVTVSEQTERYVPVTNPTPPMVQSNSIAVSWPAPDGEEFVEYYLLEYIAVSRAGQSSGRKRRQAGTSSRNITVPAPQTSTQVMGADLQPFSDYTFRVFADFGNGLVSQIVAPFNATSAERVLPAPPSLNVVDVFHVTLTLSWMPPADTNGAIRGYNVCIPTGCEPAEMNMHTLTDLSPGTTYNIGVNAVNGAGRGSVSTVTGTTTFGVFPPEVNQQMPTADLNMYSLSIGLLPTYGPISDYKIVVVRTSNRDMNTRTDVPDDLLLPAGQSEADYYAAAAFSAVGVTNTTFLVGDGGISTLNGQSFENVRLTPNQYYVFFVRAYRRDMPTSFNDSAVSRAFRIMETGVSPATIIAPIAAIAALLLIVFIILLIVAVVTRKPSTKRVHRFDDGMMDGKKKGHVVELRRTRLFSPVLNVACPDVFTSAGQPTTLLCEASGTPAPEVSWTCDGKPLDKERCIQLADSSLFIQDTDLQDEGNYLVVATNSAGTTEQMVRVTVIRPVPPEPDTMHMPIPVGDFTERIALLRLNDDEGLEDEYTDVDLDWNFTSYASKINVNKNKNRYVNIIPYDHSRVALSLQDNTPGSDYINASFIDGYNHPNAYIATQGPIPSTFPDFWRMIWELDCPTIVMVTNLKEDEKVKCNQYWPSYGTTTYGSLQVTLKEVENLAEYSIRTFNVSPLAGQSKVQMPVREVRQFHFLVWPDHGVPQFATALLSFRKRVIRYHPEKRGPMVVHCSAGVGRTGTFITIDVMLKQMEAENIIDIFNFVRHMRFRRNYMVQTSPQYIFLHDALLEAIMCGDTSIPAPELRKKLLMLMEVDSETKTTRMETQFETLNSASPADEDFDTTIAELPDNMAKNRFKHHLPSNDLRVVLSTENGQADYICASFVDGYRQRIAFIVTQAPMTNTIGDFWRMIWEQKSAAIVMLTELEEGGQEMCVKYWPVEVGQPEVFGAYQVELSDSEREVGDYITRKFKLSPIDKPQESRIITQFHYIRWPRSSAPTNTRSIIDLIDQLQRVQRKSGNGPITVHCDDGLGRTGAFCTLYTVLERVKTEQVVDIFQAIKTIRIQRTGLLETLAQYEYVHKAVLEFLDTFSDYQNFK